MSLTKVDLGLSFQNKSSSLILNVQNQYKKTLGEIERGITILRAIENREKSNIAITILEKLVFLLLPILNSSSSSREAVFPESSLRSFLADSFFMFLSLDKIYILKMLFGKFTLCTLNYNQGFNAKKKRMDFLQNSQKKY